MTITKLTGEQYEYLEECNEVHKKFDKKLSPYARDIFNSLLRRNLIRRIKLSPSSKYIKYTTTRKGMNVLMGKNVVHI